MLSQIIDSIQWVQFSNEEEYRVYVSAVEVTIHDYQSRWRLLSPYSYGFILSDVQPSEINFHELKENGQHAFIRQGNTLYIANSDDSSITLITKDPRLLEAFDNYVLKHNLTPPRGSYTQLTIHDLNIFQSITPHAIFNHRYAGSHILYNPERLVRISNIINPNMPAYNLGTAWIAPYVSGVLVSDRDTAKQVLTYYKNHRMILIDPGNNTIVWDGSNYVCTDVANILQCNAITSKMYLKQLENPSSFFRKRLNKRFTQGKQISVAYIWNIIYLENHLKSDDILDEYISEEVFRILSRLRNAFFILSAEVMSLLAHIIQYEIRDMRSHTLTEHKIQMICHAITTGCVTNILMYIVSMKTHYTPDVLDHLSKVDRLQYISKRNTNNQNALELAIVSCPEHIKILSLVIRDLHPSEQQEMLKNISGGRYNNILEYIITEHSDLYFAFLNTDVPIHEKKSVVIKIWLDNIKLTSMKFDNLLDKIKSELQTCRYGYHSESKINELNALLQALFQIKYNFIFSTKTLSEKYIFFKESCLAAFAHADITLMNTHYYWEQHVFSFFNYRNALIQQYKETNALITKLNIDMVQLHEQGGFTLVDRTSSVSQGI